MRFFVSVIASIRGRNPTGSYRCAQIRPEQIWTAQLAPLGQTTRM